MSDLLSLGASGVRAYQTALGVVGENIANAATKGYVRREVRLVESPVSWAVTPLQFERRVLGGVDTGGIAREWNQFRAADVRTAGAEVARSEAQISWLERIEASLGGNNLGAKLTGFFNAGQALAADPTGIAPRIDFLAQADAAATAFRGTADSIGVLGAEIEAETKQGADALNGLIKGLAETNVAVARAQPGTNAAAALMDERDRILDRMSTLASIAVEVAPNGVATVRLNQVNGPVLVDGATTATLGFTTNAAGTIDFTLNPFTTPQVVGLAGGALAGLADAATRIAGARMTLDELAGDFAEAVNANQADGMDLDGVRGAPMFGFAAGNAAQTIAVTALPPRGVAAAGGFSVTGAAANTGSGSAAVVTDATAAAFAAGGSYRFTINAGVVTVTNIATSATVATTPFVSGQPIEGAGFRITISGQPADGDSFAVAPVGPNSRDNANLAGLSLLRAGGRFEGRLDTMVTANASALESRRVLADTQAAIRDNAVDARDAVSGVNLDNEAVDLMRFQQAYQASSRIIQVARETFQTILDVV